PSASAASSFVSLTIRRPPTPALFPYTTLFRSEVGFTQISVSHEVSPLIRFVPRGDTTVVDAYLSPVLRRYVQQVADAMPGVTLQDRKSTRLNSSHVKISYAVFCLKKKNTLRMC